MFQIIGTYNGSEEVIDVAETAEEADQMLTFYRDRLGTVWSFRIKEPKKVQKVFP